MQTTTNYGLKKPEGNEFVSVADLNYNADEIDEALKGLDNDKVDASGGDIADTKVSEFTNSNTQWPVPDAGEAPKTLWGKVKKFIEDFKNWMTGVCLIGQIVNNCVTNNANLPLSAAQGKVLMDLYTVLNTKAQNLESGKLTNEDSEHITNINLIDRSGQGSPRLKIDGKDYTIPISLYGDGNYSPLRIDMVNSNPSTGKRSLKVLWWADGNLYTSYFDATS